jgi:cysteine desulfurase/selenocysteine lyase
MAEAPAALGDRGLFPDLEGFAYLNHASVSPPSLPVRRAAEDWLRSLARLGSRSDALLLPMRTRLRQAAAALVGGQPADVALTSGLSAGVQQVAICLPWRSGDRVVLFEGEFPANVTPWQQAAALHGLTVSTLPLADFEPSSGGSAARGLARLEDTLRRGARLVAVSAVQFRTGTAMPLREMAGLCAHHGAEIFVDGIQALGATPLDAVSLGIDYLACGAHKWLMGVAGAGFLWIRPGRAQALRPHLASWLSHEDAFFFLTRGPGHLRSDRPIRRDAAGLEGSAASPASQAALLAALEVIAGLGVPAIHDHAQRWLDAAVPGLEERGFAVTRDPGPAGRSAFCSARVPADLDGPRLRQAMGARGVALGLPDGLLRFAPHWPNAPAEVPGVLAALDEVRASGEARAA